jgi:hypothetical protein
MQPALAALRAAALVATRAVVMAAALGNPMAKTNKKEERRSTL